MADETMGPTSGGSTPPGDGPTIDDLNTLWPNPADDRFQLPDDTGYTPAEMIRAMDGVPEAPVDHPPPPTDGAALGQGWVDPNDLSDLPAGPPTTDAGSLDNLGLVDLNTDDLPAGPPPTDGAALGQGWVDPNDLSDLPAGPGPSQPSAPPADGGVAAPLC
jgi:hypothetical protein